jgi:hypothetical protein
MRITSRFPLTLLVAAAAMASLGLGGCTESMHLGYHRGEYDAAHDIERNRFQVYTLESRRYIQRDPGSRLPVRPYPQPDSRETRAYVQGYNREMRNWVGQHGLPGYNFAPGVPSDSRQVLIEQRMNDPANWVRLRGERGQVELNNGWRLRFRLRDDGQYVTWLGNARVQLPPKVTTPAVMPMPNGQLVLVQLEGEPGSLAHSVLYDPQAPDSLFLLGE